MEFMILFVDRKGAPAGEPAGMAELEKLAGDLASRGTLRRGAPLRPEAEGARIRVRDGRAFVSDGPFAEAKEVIGGFWIVEAAGREEAVELARRAYDAASRGRARATGSSRCTTPRTARSPRAPGRERRSCCCYHMEPTPAIPTARRCAR